MEVMIKAWVKLMDVATQVYFRSRSRTRTGKSKIKAEVR